MIDFHNHVLPNIDDGSDSLEMSLVMLRHAAEQGITDVVNTVHYQHPKVETEDISLERIQKEVKTLQTELDNNKIHIRIKNLLILKFKKKNSILKCHFINKGPH